MEEGIARTLEEPREAPGRGEPLARCRLAEPSVPRAWGTSAIRF